MSKTSKMIEMKLLVVVLATTDAIWSPCRLASLDSRSVIWEMRAEYRSHGVKWRPADLVQSRGPAGRQKAFKALNAVEESGLVESWVGGRERRSHVKLSPQGLKLARMLCGVSAAEETQHYSNALRKCRSEGKSWSDDHWIRETWLTHVEYDQSQETSDTLYKLEEALLPLLELGVVESNTSVGGHAWYREAHENALILDVVARDQSFGAIPNQRHSELYSEIFQSQMNVIANSYPTGKDVGLIPLPEGVGFKSN